MVFINMGTYMYPIGEGGELSYILDRGVLPCRVLKNTPTLYKYETKTDSIFQAQTWKIGKTQFKEKTKSEKEPHKSSLNHFPDTLFLVQV